MHNRDHEARPLSRIISAVSAAILTCSAATPAFCAPSDGVPLFRGAAGQSATSQPNAPVADNTLLVLLNSGSDVNKVKGYLRSEASSETVSHIHINSENYSVLQIQPPAGQRETTLSKINGMMSSHGELASVTRNYKVHMLIKPVHFFDRVPEDPYISQQWPLGVMDWFAARNKYGRQRTYTFQNAPHITILADGCDPVATDNELGAYVSQYNALDPTVTPFPEAVQGSFATGGGEGDVDTSITGCLTDNGQLIAGSGSFASDYPCYLTMLRMTTGDSVSFANIYNAIAWAINNQSARGGHGPVNLSYGDAFPAPPLWSDKTIQQMGKSLMNQGDLLVIAAGDTPGTYIGYPPGHTVVVQGTGPLNYFYQNFLTLVLGDPIGAPGAPQPGVIGGTYHTDFFGSSFSAPHVSSLIASMIAVNPNLTSKEAFSIITQTGTPINKAQWYAVVPQWDTALQHAAHAGSD